MTLTNEQIDGMALWEREDFTDPTMQLLARTLVADAARELRLRRGSDVRSMPRAHRVGYTVIEVLSFLKGLPYDEVARGYIYALRPSVVRVSVGLNTCDAVTWRVTVMMKDDKIDLIEQEVEVELVLFEHGHALRTELNRRLSPLKDQ